MKRASTAAAARSAAKKPARQAGTAASKSPESPVRRRTKAADAATTAEILRRLDRDYPDARCSLDYRSPFELLVATVLSAQCTDARVNLVTKDLFRECPDAAALASTPLARLETLVKSTGFYRNKAKNLKGLAERLVAVYGGAVPRDVESLLSLPGVARKTANVVLGNAFGIPSGVVVDTHVGRITRRLGLTRHDNPVKIERDLVAALPEERWIRFSHQLIDHGRAVCTALKPKCGSCRFADLCPSAPTGVPPR